MNFWQQKQIPYSWLPKNANMLWSGSDLESNYLANPKKADWANINISYQYNAQGFRTHDLISLYRQKVDVALGCSQTEGIGLPVEANWPSQLALGRPYPMLNLGISTGTTDTVARILTNVAGLYDIQTVFILWPEKARFETYAGIQIIPKGPGYSKIEEVWYMDNSMSEQRFNKNQSIVYMLRDQYGFKIVEDSAYTVCRGMPRGNVDPARDGMHFGFETQKGIAGKFLNAVG